MDTESPLPDPAVTPTPARPTHKHIRGLPPIPILTPAQLVFWVLISIFFHLLLVTFMVNKDAILQVVGIQPAAKEELKKTESSTSVDRIEEVVQDVREHQADLIRDKVKELVEVQKELAKADTAMIDQYKDFAQEMLDKSKDQTGESQEAAVKAQKEALAAQDEAAAAQKEMRQTAEALAQAGADQRPGLANQLAENKKKVQSAQDKVEAAQKAADAAQGDAAKSLTFAESAYTDAAKSQQDASKAQSEAGTTQQMAIVAQNDMGDLSKKITTTDEALKAREQKLNEAKEGVDRANQRLAESKASVDTANAKLAEQQTNMDTVTATGGNDKKAQKAAENAVKGAKKAADNATAQVGKTEKLVEQSKAALQKQQEAYDKALADAEAAPKAAVAQVDNVAQKQDAAQQKQEEALAAQTSTLEKVKQAQAKAAQDGAAGAPKTSAALDQAVAQAKPMEAPKDLKDASLGDLVKMATQAEDSSTELYREMRAAETATERQMTLDEARKITDVARPERSALDNELLTKKITTAEEAQAHTAAVKEAVQEIDSMISLAREIKNEVQGAPASLDAVKATATQTAALEAEAAQDYSERAKDLSELMRAAAAGETPTDPAGPHGPHHHTDPGAFYAPVAEQQANARNLATGNMMMATLAGGAPAQMGATLAGLGHEETGKALTKLAAAAAEAEKQGQGGMGAAGTAATASMENAGMSGISELSLNKDINAIHGRKVMKGDSPSSPWMYVDTWYIIGPFPNPSRQNIDKQFPPESVVDLDASYRGKDNRMVKWQFTQSDKAEIIPPNAEEYQIYYAYTELWFEEASDRWIAVGSDDYSKLWIEGMPVWKSGEQLKGWNPKEGYRKVHFKQGLNRILYRVENGWHATQFSLCINLQGPNLTQAQLSN